MRPWVLPAIEPLDNHLIDGLRIHIPDTTLAPFYTLFGYVPVYGTICRLLNFDLVSSASLLVDHQTSWLMSLFFIQTTFYMSLISPPWILALSDRLLRILLSKSCGYDLINTPLDDASILTETSVPFPPHQRPGLERNNWASQILQHKRLQSDLLVAVLEISFSFPVLLMNEKNWREMPL